MEDAGQSDTGRRLIRYIRTVGRDRFVATFEVRGRRRSLALQTFWIGKP